VTARTFWAMDVWSRVHFSMLTSSKKVSTNRYSNQLPNLCKCCGKTTPVRNEKALGYKKSYPPYAFRSSKHPPPRVLRFVTLILRMQRSTANVLALKRHDGFRVRDVIQREPKDISQISLDTIIFLGGTELFL
jgi:hypothetical protein